MYVSMKMCLNQWENSEKKTIRSPNWSIGSDQISVFSDEFWQKACHFVSFVYRWRHVCILASCCTVLHWIALLHCFKLHWIAYHLGCSQLHCMQVIVLFYSVIWLCLAFKHNICFSVTSGDIRWYWTQYFGMCQQRDTSGGAPWCADLLAHEGVLAFKATIAQDTKCCGGWSHAFWQEGTKLEIWWNRWNLGHISMWRNICDRLLTSWLLLEPFACWRVSRVPDMWR